MGYELKDYGHYGGWQIWLRFKNNIEVVYDANENRTRVFGKDKKLRTYNGLCKKYGSLIKLIDNKRIDNQIDLELENDWLKGYMEFLRDER